MDIKRIHLSDEHYIECQDMRCGIIRNSHGDEVSRLEGRPATLLFLLALNCNRPVSIEKITDYIWSGLDKEVSSPRTEISKYKKKILNQLNYALAVELPGCDIAQKGNQSFVSLTSQKGVGYKFSINPKYVEYRSRTTRTFNTNLNIEPISSNNYIDRSEILVDVRNAFAENGTHSRFVFLSGLGGIGKSELARSYAKKSKAENKFRAIVELGYYDVENPFKEAISRCDRHIISENASISESELQGEKEQLISSADECILILVNNFDKFDINFLYSLQRYTGNARVLITTRLGGNSGIEEFGTVISFDNYTDSQVDFACQIFCKYADISCPEDELVKSIVSHVGGHTMMAAILGRQAKRCNGSLKIILSELDSSVREALKVGGKVLISKDYKAVLPAQEEPTPYNILKVIFCDVLKRKFTERERQIFGAILIVGSNNIDETDAFLLATMVGDLNDDRRCCEAQSAINDLLDIGFIQKDKDRLVLHPLITQLIIDPELTEDGSTIAEISNDFIFHLLNNRFVSEDEDSSHYITSEARRWFSAISTIRDDWFINTSPQNLGWYALMDWYDTPTSSEHLRQIAHGKQIIQSEQEAYSKLESSFYLKKTASIQRAINYNHSNLDDESIITAKEVDDMFLDPVFTPKRYGIYFVINYIKGRSLWLYDYCEKKGWCLINCSEQLLPEFRYYQQGVSCRFPNGVPVSAAMVDFVSYHCPRLLFVPSHIFGVPVTTIKKDADNESIEILCLPATIEYIPNLALAYSEKLKACIFLGATCQIGKGAFTSCPELNYVCLPSKASYIGGFAFTDCPKLRGIVAPYGTRFDAQSALLQYAAVSGIIDENLQYTQTGKNGELLRYNINEILEMGDYVVLDETKTTPINYCEFLLDCQREAERLLKEKQFPTTIDLEIGTDCFINSTGESFVATESLKEKFPFYGEGVEIASPFPTSCKIVVCDESDLYANSRKRPVNGHFGASVFVLHCLYEAKLMERKGNYAVANDYYHMLMALLESRPSLLSEKIFSQKMMEIAIGLAVCYEYDSAWQAIQQVDLSMGIDEGLWCFYKGFIAGKRGYHEESLRFKLKSLEIDLDKYNSSKQTDDNNGELYHMLNLASDYNSLGETYSILGDVDRSTKYLKMGLEIRKEHLKLWTYPYFVTTRPLALSYENLGDMYFRQKTPNTILQAKEYYQAARNIVVKIFETSGLDVNRIDNKIAQCVYD